MRVRTKRKSCIKIIISGIVQGVGFRPFIYRLAIEEGLSGFVRNIGGGVEIIIRGNDERVERFIERVEKEQPFGSRLDSIDCKYVEEDIEEGVFYIVSSEHSNEAPPIIPPDFAVCDECLSEMRNRKDRRYRYPFISCTFCGPRFTVIDALPYDRERTSMDDFPMCSDCSDEYGNPDDRRFYAQTNACPDCGPEICLLTEGGGEYMADEAFDRSVEIIRSGGVVAVKGLGGYCLACDAYNEDAVDRIKSFKGRGNKPMAVMVRDIEMAKKIAEISDKAVELLLSPSAPIVVLPVKKGLSGLEVLYRNVSDGVGGIGVMLPNTPVHHLLLENIDFPIVMTSANYSEQPIIIDDMGAKALVGIFDGVLTNNRRISARADDSVMVSNGELAVISRAGRGLAPITLKVPVCSRDVIAFGSDLKNTFAFLKDGIIYQSQHIGDLESTDTFEFYKSEIERQREIYGIGGDALPVCDLSPVYYSTRYASSMGKPLMIQHHYAHLLSVLAEKGLVNGRFLGLSADGTGYGSDGAVWGCEVMAFDLSGFQRLAHLEYTPMPGGETAIRKPYRMAYSYIRTHIGDIDCGRGYVKEFISSIDEEERSMLNFAIKSGVSPQTSSLGRLFDGVSCLLGICRVNTYEAEGAMKLEATAEEYNTEPYKLEVIDDGSVKTVRLRELFMGILSDIDGGLSPGEVSYRFHITIADVLSGILIDEARVGYDAVVLSGGCFQNLLILRLMMKRLRASGIEVLYNVNTPINDANICIGQAFYGGYRLGR